MKGDSAWNEVVGGQSFDVPANATFLMKVATVSDYCCSFIK